MRKLLAMLLAALCLLSGSVALAATPVYSSAQSFAALLDKAGVLYEAQGVDYDGDDGIAIRQSGYTINCFFSGDGKTVSFAVWYVIDYSPSDSLTVMQLCNDLNLASEGAIFYADESDYTVTAAMDLFLPSTDPGHVAWRGYQCVSRQLRQAQQVLAPYDVTPDNGAADDMTIVPDLLIDATTVLVTADTAILRSGPSIFEDYIGTAYKGDEFPFKFVRGDWYAIDYRGRTVYVHNSTSTPQ